MKRLWWRTGPPIKHTQLVLRPTLAQLLRQIAVLFAIVAVWGGGFLILLDVTRSSNVAFVVETNTPTSKKTPTVVSSTPTSAPIQPAASLVTNVPVTPSLASATTTALATPTATARPTSTPSPVPPTLASTNTVSATVSFAHDVQPIFNQICVKCHGGEKTEKSLVLKTFDDLMQGSEDGPVIVPGDLVNSPLIDMIVKGKMPKNGPKLLPAQIRMISNWVKEGAPNN